MSNITVITLNKFGKRARGLLRTRISSSLPLIYPELSGFEAPDTRLKRKSYDKRKIDHVGHFMGIDELTFYIILNPNGPTKIVLKECLKINLYNGKL